MSEFRCSNCNARIHESTFRERNGLCILCFSNPQRAAHRRAVAESQKAKGVSNPTCARCGVSEAEKHRQYAEAERRGVFVYGKDCPALLYCETCDKYFCGSCQDDLGMSSGCPECGRDLMK